MALQERSSERVEHLTNSHDEHPFFDLSATGVGCLYSKPCKVGSSLALVINDCDLTAEVMYTVPRTDGARLGLKFVKVDSEHVKKLATIVDNYSRGVPLTFSIKGEIAKG